MGKQDKDDIKKLKLRIKNLRDENQKLTNENDRLKFLADQQAEKIISQKNRIRDFENEKLKSQDTQKKGSRNIAGWTVTKDGDGYFRARRFINGKTRCVYVGKRITTEIKPKLQKRDREIRIETAPE